MHLRSLATLAFCAALVSGAELPIRSVILYKHGVGYFERAGTLAPGESAHLEFKAEEMNDVLKSLTITDKGSKVTGVRYDSNIPLDRKTAEFPFQIGEGAPLSAVFDQLKGARVEMDFGPQKLSGEIVSARLIPGEKDRAEREQVTLLLDSGELRNVDLSAAAAIRFPDPKLQLQFRDYLTTLTGSRSKDKRSVYIDSADSKSRDVRASYIKPMPAWKSSYRLLFDTAAGQPTLEGWAIVDNTTGDDWTNVSMSLVSGKPISFISQLYNPKYIQREGAELPEDQAIAPTVYTGAVRQDAVAKRVGGNARGSVAGGVMGGIAGGMPSAGLLVTAPASPIQTEMSTVSVAGSAQEIADLFEYTIRNPVTVRKNESTMLPFLQRKISARKLIIYSDESRPNPLTAAELTNDSGETLDGGPITVFDGGAYAGEALIETVRSGDKRFIGYGVDLGARISTKLDSHNDDVRELHVHNGMLITRSALVQKKTFTIHNADPKAKTLILEYPVRAGYALIETPKPMETAANVYRFEVKVPASATVEFPVTEENVYDRQTAISSITPENLLVYVRNKSLTDNARTQLRQISDLKDRIAANETEKRRLESDVQSATADETRTRQNITSLSGVGGQQQAVQDYARKLSAQEGQISTARDREVQLDSERAALQNQLNAAIAKLDF